MLYQADSALFGEFVEKAVILTFPLPAVSVVTIVCGDDHDPAFVIENSATCMSFAPRARNRHGISTSLQSPGRWGQGSLCLGECSVFAVCFGAP